MNCSLARYKRYSQQYRRLKAFLPRSHIPGCFKKQYIYKQWKKSLRWLMQLQSWHRTGIWGGIKRQETNSVYEAPREDFKDKCDRSHEAQRWECYVKPWRKDCSRQWRCQAQGSEQVCVAWAYASNNQRRNLHWGDQHKGGIHGKGRSWSKSVVCNDTDFGFYLA